MTIDGEDARDFDDALYCEPQKASGWRLFAGGWKLYVAIADVSHYVPVGSALDMAATSTRPSSSSWTTTLQGSMVPILSST
ncbi:MAG: RNB domain-containing ribonuclease [Desulfurivibrionaceae bacterium]